MVAQLHLGPEIRLFLVGGYRSKSGFPYVSLLCSVHYTVRIHREIHFLTGTPLLKIVVSPVPDGVGRPYGTLRVGKFAILANGTVSGRIGIEPETCEQKINLFSQFFHLSAPNFVNLLYTCP